MTESGGEWEGTGLVCVSGEDEEAPVSSSSALVMVKFTSAVTVVADEGTVINVVMMHSTCSGSAPTTTTNLLQGDLYTSVARASNR